MATKGAKWADEKKIKHETVENKRIPGGKKFSVGQNVFSKNWSGVQSEDRDGHPPKKAGKLSGAEPGQRAVEEAGKREAEEAGKERIVEGVGKDRNCGGAGKGLVGEGVGKHQNLGGAGKESFSVKGVGKARLFGGAGK